MFSIKQTSLVFPKSDNTVFQKPYFDCFRYTFSVLNYISYWIYYEKGVVWRAKSSVFYGVKFFFINASYSFSSIFILSYQFFFNINEVILRTNILVINGNPC